MFKHMISDTVYLYKELIHPGVIDCLQINEHPSYSIRHSHVSFSEYAIMQCVKGIKIVNET